MPSNDIESFEFGRVQALIAYGILIETEFIDRRKQQKMTIREIGYDAVELAISKWRDKDLGPIEPAFALDALIDQIEFLTLEGVEDYQSVFRVNID